MKKYIILNYQSEKGIDGKPSYNFWFTSSLIRVIGNKPFSRGDIAEITDIKKVSGTEWNIHVNILGDYTIDPEAMDLVQSIQEDEIPTLIFATTKIYLDKDSDLHIYTTDNIEILLNCSSEMNNNKSYTIAALVKGSQGKIFGLDKINGTSLEWLVTDKP
jgi:hypothetical protein